MLFAAGAGAQVLGTSDYSNEPQAALRIERVGDAQSFDLERILALHPDVVVVWSGGTNAAQIDKLERVGLKVYRHRIDRLSDIPASLRRLGVLAGTQSTALAAAATLETKIAALEQRYASAQDGSVLIQNWRGYPTLKAVRNRRLIAWTDQRLSRLGPSMVDATEVLCRALRRQQP